MNIHKLKEYPIITVLGIYLTTVIVSIAIFIYIDMPLSFLLNFETFSNQYPAYTIYNMFIYNFIEITICLWIIKKFNIDLKINFQKALRYQNLTIIISVGILIAFLSQIILSISEKFLPYTDLYDPNAPEILIFKLAGYNYAALINEFMFSSLNASLYFIGIGYTLLIKKYSLKKVIIILSIIGCLFALDPASMPSAILDIIVVIFIYRKTESLFNVLIVIAIINLIDSLLLMF